jgi:phosphonate transport system substrate-binding protein
VSLKDVEFQPVKSLQNNALKIAVSAIISPKQTFIYYREILDYIAREMGVHVELVQRDTYAEVNNMVKDNEIIAAFVCSGAYIDGHKAFGMELLVAPKAYGESYYYSYIIVPSNSSARQFEDLRGKKFAFTDPMSNSGKLSPTFMLANMGEKPKGFFSDVIFTYSHDKSIEAVALGLVDGAAVDSLIWDYSNDTNPEFTSKTRIIKKSPPYGIPPVVVPKGLSPDVREKMRDIFLNMHLNAEGSAILKKVKIDRFILTKDSAYNSIREMRNFVNKMEQDEG